MYTFIDVTEVSEGAALPSEALSINGEYIENQIEGYRTLYVSGREALSSELTTFETGVRDGSVIQYKRYPARTIVVGYQLIAESAESFRTAYNALASILNVQDAELIFNDETDKFFKGTPSSFREVEAGKNAVVGEFEIFCADPFKYSVIEYEATPELVEGSILIDYNGTYKAYPTLAAEFHNETDASEDGTTVSALTGNGDCGYIAFFNENEKIIQLGDAEEADSEVGFAKSQTLANSTFKTSSAWGSAAKSQWAVNKGITSSEAVEQAGNVAMAVASYATPATPKDTSGTLLTKSSTANTPKINYTLKYAATNRTANSVKVAVTITTALDKDANYFGRGYGLKGHLYIGGAWREFTIKTTDEYWRGKSGHTKNLTVTITGLAASATSIGGIKFKTTRIDNLGTAGLLSETACNNIAISAYVADTPETYYLAPSGFGSGANWHGPSITRTLPADAAGKVGATNFTLTYAQKMSIGSGSNATNQLGAFQCLVTDANGNVVAGVNVYKGGAGKSANLRFYVGGKTMLTIQVDLSYNNAYFKDSKTTSITKVGGNVTFDVCGIKKSFNDIEIAETVATKVTFTMTQFGTKPALAYNGLYWAKFVKNNCDTWKDIPNKFSANDIVEADCKSGEIYLNGVLTPSLGALGNDWEGFYLTAGLNQIGFTYSDWVAADYAPSFKVKYRETFL